MALNDHAASYVIFPSNIQLLSIMLRNPFGLTMSSALFRFFVLLCVISNTSADA